MTKRKLIAQLRECAEDVDRKPILLFSSRYSGALAFSANYRDRDAGEYFGEHPRATILLLLILADMLEAE